MWGGREYYCALDIKPSLCLARSGTQVISATPSARLYYPVAIQRPLFPDILARFPRSFPEMEWGRKFQHLLQVTYPGSTRAKSCPQRLDSAPFLPTSFFEPPELQSLLQPIGHACHFRCLKLSGRIRRYMVVYDLLINSQLKQFTLEPHVVQNWPRNARKFEPTNPSNSSV